MKHPTTLQVGPDTTHARQINRNSVVLRHLMPSGSLYMCIYYSHTISTRGHIKMTHLHRLQLRTLLFEFFECMLVGLLPQVGHLQAQQSKKQSSKLFRLVSTVDSIESDCPTRNRDRCHKFNLCTLNLGRTKTGTLPLYRTYPLHHKHEWKLVRFIWQSIHITR